MILVNCAHGFLTTVAPQPNRKARFVYLKVPSDLDVSVHGSRLSSPDQPLQLCTTVVLGLSCQFFDVNVRSEQVEVSHLAGVDVQNLDTALLIRQTWKFDHETVRDKEKWMEGKDGYGKVKERD